MGEVRVLKFGGSSVASAELIHKVARIVKEHYQVSQQVVVVVSAMGKSTDQLLSLANEVSPHAQTQHRRELDMLVSVGERISMSLLSMAIGDLGIEAVSLTGSQSGIITSDSHGDAEILEIKGDRILKALSEKKVVIVAGFQGVSRNKEITTLGRGGSDTSAVALGVFLKAPCVRIYSDVDAYFSADPKLVPTARKIPEISWSEGGLSSYFGAKVLHYRAVECAAVNQMEIHLLSTSNPHAQHGLLKGGVSQKTESFCVLTLNLKKGLQKLTTKIHNGLDIKHPSELGGLFYPPKAFLPENRGAKVSVHFGEKIERHQVPDEKNFSIDESEYWALSLVGHGLDTKPSLSEEVTSLLEGLKIGIIDQALSSEFATFFTKAFPNEAEVLQKVHACFFEKQS